MESGWDVRLSYTSSEGLCGVWRPALRVVSPRARCNVIAHTRVQLAQSLLLTWRVMRENRARLWDLLKLQRLTAFDESGCGGGWPAGGECRSGRWGRSRAGCENLVLAVRRPVRLRARSYEHVFQSRVDVSQ